MELQDGLPIVGLLVGGFYLYKLRAEENLRTRLTLAAELYETFSHLNEVVRVWASPIALAGGKEGEVPDARLERELSELNPRVQAAFHRATLIMPPLVCQQVRSMLDRVGKMQNKYQTFLMLRDSRAGKAGMEQEMRADWDEARTVLPAQIAETHKLLLDSLTSVVHGPVTAWRWRRERSKILTAERGARGTGRR